MLIFQLCVPHSRSLCRQTKRLLLVFPRMEPLLSERIERVVGLELGLNTVGRSDAGVHSHSHGQRKTQSTVMHAYSNCLCNENLGQFSRGIVERSLN